MVMVFITSEVHVYLNNVYEFSTMDKKVIGYAHQTSLNNCQDVAKDSEVSIKMIFKNTSQMRNEYLKNKQAQWRTEIYKGVLPNCQVLLLLNMQANQRIIDGVATQLEVPSEPVISNVANYSDVVVPLALDVAVRSGKKQPGHVISSARFGAGLTWASAIFRWGSMFWLNRDTNCSEPV
ncbi:uncharacterized protein LOC132066220 [Lycium ferocissimum]|uniref:uncharacterized protein LOC132066220 n=1 Tax=Lycium ferocissimum TaxID=112874 RepID=UPI002814DBFB|nr:uncharacterized protein LOC132066220 [Lycium ferocissimum]